MYRLLWIAAVLVGCGDDAMTTKPDAALPASPLTLRVLSSRPDMVTAGDALVEIAHGAEYAGAAITVTFGDTDVSDRFTAVGTDKRVGLVEGLPLGEVSLDAALADHTPVRLGLVTYPVTGPVISGPHQSPFVCKTVESGLGAPLDANCSVQRRDEYYYKSSTDSMFKPLADPSQVPADVAMIERTGDKVMIPYVVRIERGTINRAVYQITSLVDPLAWNKKLIYAFRGGCGEGHHQGALPALDDMVGGVYPLYDAPVGAGFAVASSSLNTLGVTCNDVGSAGTGMMVKDRFIERYGVPLYTTGWGGSGGSIQQHLIAENYPGILDGIVPAISYPDVMTIYDDVMDCPLLVDYFTNKSAGRYPQDADRADAAGFANATTCAQWNGAFGHFEDPNVGCDPSVPAGTRCTFVDNQINLLGTDTATGFANEVYDNVGVQYGLAALAAGQITTEQFVHLNETIGGYGPDGAHVAQRSVASTAGLRAAYTGGRVTRGNKGLATIPIVDLRIYTDDLGDIHDRVRSNTMRARLTRANGDARNQILVISSYDANAYLQAALGALIVQDAWLTALQADTNPDRAAAVRATRPANVTTDVCFLPNMNAMPTACEQQLPTHSTPRLIAGAPAQNDVLKCQLKPLNQADYNVTFTTGEWSRLQAAFPSGVCDYSVAGVEQVEATSTWQSFGPAP